MGSKKGTKKKIHQYSSVSTDPHNTHPDEKKKPDNQGILSIFFTRISESVLNCTCPDLSGVN